MKNNDFQKLLEIAMKRSRSQREFAIKAGISQEHLSRMIMHPEKYKPSITTLRKIADASDGWVTLSMLEKSCGFNPGQAPQEEPEYAVGSVKEPRSIIGEYKAGLLDFSGRALRYNDEQGVLDTVGVICSRAKFQYAIENKKEYTGHGHSGAERTANVTVSFATNEYQCSFGFVMFYCRTEKGGVIFSDAAFDLLTLHSFDHPLSARKLLDLSVNENIDMAKYQTVYLIEKIME